MTYRRCLLFALIGLYAAFILASCETAVPRISSIRSDPDTAEKGGTVRYTILYRNYSQENSFSDTVVVVRYDEHLSFNQNASPFPSEINERQRELRWEVGRLDPGQDDSIKVEFKLSPKIPLAVYELKIIAEISSTDAQGSRIRREGTGRTLIEGHPTPTPRPTNTPRPTTPTPAP